MTTVSETLINKEQILDDLHLALMNFPSVDCPLIHLFTKGMYVREILMPKDTVVVSKKHLTNHPFVISQGKAAVYNSEQEFSGILQAPYTGITTPNTRRVLHILETCIWTTFHPLPYITGEENNWSDEEKLALVDRIESEIIEKHDIMLNKVKEQEALA